MLLSSQAEVDGKFSDDEDERPEMGQKSAPRPIPKIASNDDSGSQSRENRYLKILEKLKLYSKKPDHFEGKSLLLHYFASS